MLKPNYKTRIRKKDYQAKGLKNPFFRVKKKKTSKAWKWRFVFFVLILAIIIWFFWWSPVFSIKDIKVEGLSRVSPNSLSALAWQETELSRHLVFKQKNIFCFDKNDLRKKINASYNFASLEINKHWLKRTISIKIAERAYALIWQEGNSYYFSDKDGNLIKDEAVSEEQKKQFLVLENRSNGSLIINDNKINLNKDYLPFIFPLADKIKNYPDFKINKYFIDNELNTIKLSLADGPEVYFSTREDLTSQLDKLLVVKRETIKDNFNKIRYIDLRYKDKVYYQ